MNSEVLNFHANLAANREIFLLNFKEELNAFDETNALLNNVIQVIGTARDKDGFSHVSFLPFLMLMSRQALNAFESISTYRSYQAWVLLRPSLECALIMGKWFDDPKNAKIWENRDRHWKTYQKAYTGKALLSNSLQNSQQIRNVLTRINDDFMHTNPRYYFRHTETHPVDTKDIWVQVRFNDHPTEHEAHLYAFLHLTRFLVESLGSMFATRFGERPELNAKLKKVQDYFRGKVTTLVETTPEAQTVLVELGLWPTTFF